MFEGYGLKKSFNDKGRREKVKPEQTDSIFCDLSLDKLECQNEACNGLLSVT